MSNNVYLNLVFTNDLTISERITSLVSSENGPEISIIKA